MLFKSSICNFEAGQQKTDAIPLLLIPLVMIGTWLTHLFGGSAGREGVAVQIGATLSHAIGRKFKFPENGRLMLVIGMAAGFGGLFQTPLSATFFAIEVIVIGKMDYEALLPALASAYTAAFTSHSLGLEKVFSCNERYSKSVRNKDDCSCDLPWDYFWTDRTIIFILTKQIKSIYG